MIDESQRCLSLVNLDQALAFLTSILTEQQKSEGRAPRAPGDPAAAVRNGGRGLNVVTLAHLRIYQVTFTLHLLLIGRPDCAGDTTQIQGSNTLIMALIICPYI